jgi:hypothetical protein
MRSIMPRRSLAPHYPGSGPPVNVSAPAAATGETLAVFFA